MAVAGGAKPSVTMKIENGVLIEKSRGMRQGVSGDFDDCVRRLMAGETVAVQSIGTLTSRVEEEVNKRLSES